MNDLVQRLRSFHWQTMTEAAARIEALEAALREIANYWDEAPVDNSAWNIWAYKVQKIARAALDKETP